MKRLIALLATTTLALTLTACSTPGLKPNGHTTGASKTATPKPAKPAEGAKGAKAATATPTDVPISQMFGETYTSSRSLSVTVSSPVPYAPPAGSQVEPAAAYVQFTLTMKNATSQEVPLADLRISVESHDTKSRPVLDTETAKQMDDVVSAGGQSVFTFGYGVADPTDVTLKVRLAYGETPVTFTT